MCLICQCMAPILKSLQQMTSAVLKPKPCIISFRAWQRITILRVASMNGACQLAAATASVADALHFPASAGTLASSCSLALVQTASNPLPSLDLQP